MAEMLTDDALVENFGVTIDDLVDWADPLPLDIQDRGPLWMTVYLAWLARRAHQSGARPALSDTQTLERWWPILDAAADELRANPDVASETIEPCVAHALLTHDPESPYYGANVVPDSHARELARVLAKTQDIALNEIDSRVGTLGQLAPLVWSEHPGPEERRLRLRSGNLLFPRDRRQVGPWTIEEARWEDRDALRKLVERYHELQRRQVGMGATAPVDACYLLLKEYDGLNVSLLIHGTPDALRWRSDVVRVSAGIVVVINAALARDSRARQAFQTWRDVEANIVREHSNRAYVTLATADDDEFGPTLCSLEADEMAEAFVRLDTSREVGDGIRQACAFTFERAVAEGFPADVAAARLKAIQRSAGEPRRLPPEFVPIEAPGDGADIEPGPAERRLRRGQDNLLFPRAQRTVSDAQLDRARTEDAAALCALVAGYRALLARQTTLTGIPTIKVGTQMLEDYDAIELCLLMHGTREAMRWREEVVAISGVLSASLMKSLPWHSKAQRAFARWRDTVREREQKYREPMVAELLSTPPDDVVYTLCSFEPEAIAIVMRDLDGIHWPDGGIRSACAEVFADAITEGFPEDIANARLRALMTS